MAPRAYYTWCLAHDNAQGSRESDVRWRKITMTIITSTARSCPRCSCACARWKPCWPRRAISTRPRSTPSSRPTRPRSARTTARGSSPRPGAIRRSSAHCSRTRPRRCSTLGLINRVGDHLIAVENTPKLHNMIVCTLCSCYPWEVLGLPPVWYKSAPYRSRAVNDPRGVLADFGLKLPADTEIRVWDSTAETRFIVLPMRPAGYRGLERRKTRRAGHARLHDRHRPAEKTRGDRHNGRRPRHGRHARLRQGRARRE
jgi:hypothetical protein